MVESVSKQLNKELFLQNKKRKQQTLAGKLSTKKAERDVDELHSFCNLSTFDCLVLDCDKKIIERTAVINQLLGESTLQRITSAFLPLIPTKFNPKFKEFLEKPITTRQNESCKTPSILNNKTLFYIDLIGRHITKNKHQLSPILNSTQKTNGVHQLKEVGLFVTEINQLSPIASFKLNIAREFYEISNAFTLIFKIPKDAVFNFLNWPSVIHKDHRIGVPKHVINYLSAPFDPAYAVGTVKRSASGISIVKNFMDSHKGQLFVASIFGEEAKVTLTIPFLKEEL
jgi:hypothetical protein